MATGVPLHVCQSGPSKLGQVAGFVPCGRVGCAWSGAKRDPLSNLPPFTNSRLCRPLFVLGTLTSSMRIICILLCGVLFGSGRCFVAACRVPGRAFMLPPPCVPPVVLNSVPTFGGFVGLLMCLVLLCLISLLMRGLRVFLRFRMGVHGLPIDVG
jgi:hypothetical protein